MNARILPLCICMLLIIQALGNALWAQGGEPALPQQVVAAAEAPPAPEFKINNPRGVPGQRSTLELNISKLPEDAKRIVIKIAATGLEFSSLTTAEKGSSQAPYIESAAAEMYSLEAQLFTPIKFSQGGLMLVLDRRAVGEASPSGLKLILPMNLPSKIGKGTISISGEVISNNATVVQEAVPSESSWGTSRFSAPASVFGLLAVVVAGVFALSTLPALKGFFTYLPPLIWMYFIPMLLTTFGVTPDTSPLYSPFFSRIILPAILVLLIIPTDIRTVSQLGAKAVGVMLFATLGIVCGAIGSFWFFNTFFGSSLPPDTWKGLAGLSGSWIGGSPNMTAVFESVGASPSIIGPMIIVDTVVAYSWLGLLVALSGYKERIDAFNKADSRIIDELNARLQVEQETHQRAPRALDVALMVGLAFGLSQLCLWVGPMIYDVITSTGDKFFSSVLSGYAWGILLITAAGLYLSTTKARTLDFCGASNIGTVGLYLMLTTYGAQADLRAILDVPILFGIGIMWLMIHIIVLAVGVRLLRAPLFMLATGSMANIGGTASAPVVAAAYYPSMAPVGLLMAIIGGSIGTPVALLLVASSLRWLAGA
ncbi:MAG: DUF819 domain-containing protein [Sumerlaeia bacterium]